ncbi:hypothetical protein PF011_g27721 [Phytophthora fragariae]|uniref:Lipoprotein n=1 Tax=Phytophthora fragariae TaxID=53985 RepID=A0A6A3HCV4_9STRA|nr:hypothetical protein PF011_g27721 [Phytophthora fragariae]
MIAPFVRNMIQVLTLSSLLSCRVGDGGQWRFASDVCGDAET